jgi:SAM-dependent methyltransferase
LANLRRAVNEAYWDSVAADYCGNILSVFEHDTTGLVRARIGDAEFRGARAADMGCGVGKFTSLLAARFGEVEACDLSTRCLDEARRHCAEFGNITYHQLDFARDVSPFEPVDFVLCVNVLIMPSLDERMRAWRMVTNQVVSGGTLLLVVPSHESMLYVNFRTLGWGLHAGLSCAQTLRRNVPQTGSIRDLHQGVRPLEGVPTKHYLREELEVMLDEHHFEVSELIKLEHDWATVIADPEQIVAGPPSWQWLVVARRR